MPKTKSGTLQYSDEELDRQFAEATTRGLLSTRTEPHAQDIDYDRVSNRIALDLDNGTSFAFPTSFVKELADASPEEISDVSIAGHGTALRWNALDLDLGVVELIAGIYGTRTWMATLGQKGGSVKSAAKTAAARVNGKKGGRPRVQPRLYVASSRKDGFEAQLTASRNIFPDLVAEIEQSLSISPIALERLSRGLVRAMREWTVSFSRDVAHAKLTVKPEQSAYETISGFKRPTTVKPLQKPSRKEANNADLTLAA